MTIDWGPGPWENEPKRVEWRHAGLPCLVRRGMAWCGYVGVPPGHPLHGVGYGQCPVECAHFTEYSYCTEHEPDYLIDVHGGLTYAAPCDGDEADGICHVPAPGEPEDVWWFGFDCAHYDDLVPGYSGVGVLNPGAVYRDIAYVQAETERLADQLAALARP